MYFFFLNRPLFCHSSRGQRSEISMKSGARSGCHHGLLPAGSSGGESILMSSASGVSWQSLACGCIPSVFKVSIFEPLSGPSLHHLLCVCHISLCLPLLMSHVIALGALRHADETTLILYIYDV